MRSLFLALLSCGLLPAHLHSALVTVQNEVAGPTPEILAYNLAHFLPGSNTTDWWRYSRVSGARIFISPAHFETSATKRFGDATVVDKDSFIARRAALRADPLDTNFINWPAIITRFNTQLSGNNRILPQYAFEEIQRHGGVAMGQISLSENSFPINGEDDWAGKWIAWRTYYSMVFYTAREFGTERFTAFNEPNHANSFISPVPWLMRARLASDATRSAIADVNRIYGRELTPIFVAPVTATGPGTAYTQYGKPAVQGQQVNFLGQESVFNRLFDLYAYQEYNSSPAGFVSNLNSVRNSVQNDLPDTSLPVRFSITEYNVHTGANYDTMVETPDTLSKATRFGAITSQLMRNGMDEFYAFKFGMTAYPTTRNYPVQKNGMLYTDNNNAPHNYGTMTRSAEVYRLFNKAFAPGRNRLEFDISGTGAAGLEIQISHDPKSGFYYVFSINEGGSAIPFELDLSSLNIPDGNHVIIEDVSQWRRGIMRSMERVQNGRLEPGSQPGNTVWLISIPGNPQREITEDSNLLTIPISQDVRVVDGTHSSTNYGNDPIALVKNHATDPNERSATFLQFDLPDHRNLQDLQMALVAIPMAPISGGGEYVQAHLYGIDSHNWDQSSITWQNAPNLKKGTPPGNQIRHGVVSGAGETAHILAQLSTSGSYAIRRVDVTDYLIRQTTGKASFLITQDPRWDIDIHQATLPEQWSDLPQGDDQPDGLRIRTSREATAAQPASHLILIYNAPAKIDFDSWIGGLFPGIVDPEVIGPEANPANDGIPNLLKFALALDPRVSNRESISTQEADENGKIHFYYKRNKLATNIALYVEQSSDLVHWSTEGVSNTILSETDEIAHELAVITPLSSANRLFVRLQAVIQL